MQRRDYEFFPVTRADLPTLRRWLREPHVRAWWGDPEAEIALIEADLEIGPTDMRMIRNAGRPFAYVQDFPAHHWEMPHYAARPKGTRAIDSFLGEPAVLGRGHAAAYLRSRAEALSAAGAPAVVIDPDPANECALHACRAAGYRGEEIRPGEDGSPVIVMEFRPS